MTVAIGIGVFERERKQLAEDKSPLNLSEKVYIAVEGDSKVIIIDSAQKKVVKKIDLSTEHRMEDGHNATTMYAPHNVQVAPNGKSVWVTANMERHIDHSSLILNVYAHSETGTMENAMNIKDEVIVIDPLTDKIIIKIPLGIGDHLAHVVISPDSKYAYVTAQKSGVIYKINTLNFNVENKIILSNDSEPHGLRISSDGKTGFVALMKGRALGILDLIENKITLIPLNGQAVQTGITPNGDTAVVSVYDAKILAVYDTLNKSLQYIELPENSRGPIQMYPTPDSRYMYLADQGYYFGQPSSQLVYKIDLKENKIVKEIKAGFAPHGVVVSKDGKFVYVTNLLSGDVSIIDVLTDTEITRIPVGKEPNGISIWNKYSGGTP